MKKRVMIFLVALAFVIPVILFAASAPKKAMKVKKSGNKKSAVMFDHNKHSAVKDCDGCHKAAKTKNASHKYCRDCHKSKGGPTKCKQCHK